MKDILDVLKSLHSVSPQSSDVAEAYREHNLLANEVTQWEAFAIGYIAGQKNEQFLYKKDQAVIAFEDAGALDGRVGIVVKRSVWDTGRGYHVRYQGVPNAVWFREDQIRSASESEIQKGFRTTAEEEPDSYVLYE